MGTWVDRDERAREIHRAAFRLIQERGYAQLSLRSLAEELGGSMTLVTHYFSSQTALMESLLEYQLEEFDEDLALREHGVDASSRLRILVDWFLPNDEQSLSSERLRVLMQAQVPRDTPWMRPYLDRVEARMTELIREHLLPVVAPADLDIASDTLRMALNGVVLSAVEHPEKWDRARQSAVMQLVLDSLPLGEAVPDAPAS
jgi:AcrR family transcriptional regulator